ncbi:MAG TPA: hypothetical protein VMT17_12125 [Anaeromyxobacteraceae bacterium]|nr:hypothetical protein [Anaeromyxobacteraceae bacterium]
MVDHLTRVSMKLVEPDPLFAELGAKGSPTPEGVLLAGDRLRDRTARVAAMMVALRARGFTFRLESTRVVAESTTVGAREVKHHLASLGFRGDEFQVRLEYVRQWGVL